MPAFLNTIFYVISFNLMGILFFSAALYFGKRGKTFWHWYYIGLGLQGYSVFGAILGMLKVPEEWRTVNNYVSIAFFVITALVAFLLLKREEARVSPADHKSAKGKK